MQKHLLYYNKYFDTLKSNDWELLKSELTKGIEKKIKDDLMLADLPAGHPELKDVPEMVSKKANEYIKQLENFNSQDKISNSDVHTLPVILQYLVLYCLKKK